MKFLFGALVGGFLLFQSQASPKKVAGKIAGALRAKYPDAKVEVDVKGKRGTNVLNGRFDEVAVRMADFSAGAAGFSLVAVPDARKKGFLGKTSIRLQNFGAGGVRVAALNLEWNDVVYDRAALTKDSRLAIVSAGAARGELVLAADALLPFIAAKMPEVENARLRFSGGLMTLSGTRAAPLVGTPIGFSLVAKPVARGRELWLEDVQIAFGGAQVPEAFSKSLVGNLNPIFVFDKDNKFPFRITKSAVALHDDNANGTLQLSSELEFVPALQSPQVR